MFDFEKLDVYNEVKEVNLLVLKFIYSGKIEDAYLSDQLKRATLNIQLNLAEGTGRFSSKEKKHLATLSRSSVFESVALMDLLLAMGKIDKELYRSLYDRYERISKMLLGFYRNVKED
jgi:four helix bundle protein